MSNSCMHDPSSREGKGKGTREDKRCRFMRQMGEVTQDEEDSIWLGASRIMTRSATASGSSSSERVDMPSQAPFVIVIAKPHFCR